MYATRPRFCSSAARSRKSPSSNRSRSPMVTEAPGAAVPTTYLVTIVETYRVEAESEEDAITVADGLHDAHQADTVDLQVEVLP